MTGPAPPPPLDATPAAPPPRGRTPGAAGALRLLIVTDAWAPQVNGVVRTLSTVFALLRAGGDAVEVVGPDRFRTVPAPLSWKRRSTAQARRGGTPARARR